MNIIAIILKKFNNLALINKHIKIYNIIFDKTILIKSLIINNNI